MQMNFVRPAVTALALGALMFATTPAMAETVAYKADLKGTSAVPPNDSKGTGNLDAAYDTASKKMTYTITYAGLSGPATAAQLSAGTIHALPPACEGSMITGKWVSFFSTGIAVTSSTLR